MTERLVSGPAQQNVRVKVVAKQQMDHSGLSPAADVLNVFSACDSESQVDVTRVKGLQRSERQRRADSCDVGGVTSNQQFSL